MQTRHPEQNRTVMYESTADNSLIYPEVYPFIIVLGDVEIPNTKKISFNNVQYLSTTKIKIIQSIS